MSGTRGIGWGRCAAVAAVIFAWSLGDGVLDAAAANRGADGKYEKRTSSHFVLHQDVAIDRTSGLRGSRSFEQNILKELEIAYDRLEHFLGLRPKRPITVVVHAASVFDEQFGGHFRFPAAGFYMGKIHIRGDVVVHERLVRTLNHELVHAAFHAESPSLVLPAWFNEGVAEWFEARSLGKRLLSRGEYNFLASMARDGSLLSLADMSAASFGHFGPNAAQLAYVQSYAFFEFLARTHGEQTLRELCRELMRIQNLDRAVQKTFRADLLQLQLDFFDELASTVGG